MIKKACELCGKVFTRYGKLAKTARFCSATCYHLSDRRRHSVEERFRRQIKIRDKTSCWLWVGSVGNHGYGQLTICSGKVVTAHRLAWIIFCGKIEKGKCVLHKCDVKRCVNPKHLYIGDPARNSKDWCRRGHGNRGENNGMAKLTDEQIKKIRLDDRLGAEIASEYKIGRDLVYKIRQKRYRNKA